MKAHELSKKLFEGFELNGKQSFIVEEVLCAYAESHEGLKEERNLGYFSLNAVDGTLAILIAEKCIRSYNEFNAKIMEKVVAQFGNDALYFFAREGSVCIYVRPMNENIYFDGRQIRNFKEDEFSYDPHLQMFRIWWD